MKNVTYAIEYKKTDTLAEGYAFYIEQYKQHLAKNKKIKAAQQILELVEWLVDDDQGFDQDQLFKYLDRTLKYCQKVISVLKEARYPFLLAKAYHSMSQIYAMQEIYDQAIHYALESTQLLLSQHKPEDEDKMDLDQPKIKLALQSTYRLIGNVYFTKSLDLEASRFSDYQQAVHFYELERQVIEDLTLADIDSTDEDDLVKLKQSVYFNMGVMKCKLPDKRHDAKHHLNNAVKLAQKLEDGFSEKTAWWELGNLYKALGDHDMVKQCQMSEHAVAIRLGLSEDIMTCYEERIKYHLYLNEFNACIKLHKQAVDTLGTESKRACKRLLEMVIQIKTMKDEIEYLGKKGDVNAPIAAKFLAYVRALDFYELYRVVIDTIDQGYLVLSSARDFSSLIYGQLLHIKTETLWKLNESTQQVYLESSNEAFDYVEASLKESPLNQYMLTIDILQLRTRIYEYFDLGFQQQATEKLLAETKRQEELLRYKLQNRSAQLHVYPRITPSFTQLTKKTMCVKILSDPPVDLHITYEPAPETVRLLMKDIAVRCWHEHGFEPNISHLRTRGHDILPEDLVYSVITEENQYVEAQIDGTHRKLPHDLYLNTCQRFNIAKIESLEYALRGQTITDISFKGLNIKAFDQFRVIQHILKHSSALYRLNLASNMLVDQDIDQLLTCVSPSLGDLNLSNNRITSACLDYLIPFRIYILNLSHNPVDALFFLQLPSFLEKKPGMKRLYLENTEIGKANDIIHRMVREKPLDLKLSCLLTINLSSNHFEQDMLSKLTELWCQYNYIEALELTSITSDFGWNNFDMLSDLQRLTKLSFKRSIKTTLAYCHFKELFILKKNLMELDLTSCGLDLEDMVLMGYSLVYIERLNRLVLSSNPQIGDAGIQYLDEAIEKSKIIALSISNCGLTSQSHQRILRWSNHIKMMDITKNAIFDYHHLPERIKTTIRLDAIESPLSLETKQVRVPGLSFQRCKKLPLSPFDR